MIVHTAHYIEKSAVGTLRRSKLWYFENIIFSLYVTHYHHLYLRYSLFLYYYYYYYYHHHHRPACDLTFPMQVRVYIINNNVVYLCIHNIIYTHNIFLRSCATQITESGPWWQLIFMSTTCCSAQKYTRN